VDAMIESRIVLEKIKPLEAKLRYQIEKLVRVAEEPESVSTVIDGRFFCSYFLHKILTTTQTPWLSVQTPKILCTSTAKTNFPILNI
jgi:hypothetical protein